MSAKKAVDKVRDARNKLTIQQQRFVEEYVRGVPAGRAYENAGYSTKTENSADCSASRLLGNAKVKAYINALRDIETENTVLSRQERLQMLSRIGKANEKGKPNVAIRANSELNRMTGEYRAESVNVEGNLTLWEAITGKRRKQV